MKLLKSIKAFQFEDSNSSLYRFLDNKLSHVFYRRMKDGQSGLTDRRKEKESLRLGEEIISNPLAQEFDEGRTEEFIYPMNENRGVPPSTMTDKPVLQLSKRVVEDVWKEQTLRIQLIDISCLENILESPIKTQNFPVSKKEDLIISNTCLDREVIPNLCLSEMDNWLKCSN